MMQLYDIGTRLMVDLQMITPVQEFIDKDNYDVSTLSPMCWHITRLMGSKLQCPSIRPRQCCITTKTCSGQGLDPEKPPRTFEEVWEAARVLTQKDASGNVVVSGISMSIYGWFFEQFLAVSGGYYANNANGRDALATEATLTVRKA